MSTILGGAEGKTMSVGGETAREDLAYLRGLVGDDAATRAGAGAAFLWAGLLYGLQCLVQWAQVIGLVHFSDAVMFWFLIGVSSAFVLAMAAVMLQARKSAQGAQSGLAARALNGVFGGVGIANAVLAIVFGYAASQAHDFTIWLFQPIMVCVLQGVTWFVVWHVRRRAWLGVVAFGWLAAAIGLGVLRSNIGAYLLVLAFALLVLMAGTGLGMLRSAKAQA